MLQNEIYRAASLRLGHFCMPLILEITKANVLSNLIRSCFVRASASFYWTSGSAHLHALLTGRYLKRQQAPIPQLNNRTWKSAKSNKFSFGFATALEFAQATLPKWLLREGGRRQCFRNITHNLTNDRIIYWFTET